jgi:hypothetical protein
LAINGTLVIVNSSLQPQLEINKTGAHQTGLGHMT